MASQPAYQPQAQNKGTLVPGQTIAVNNYTVQVERYLSQGGFAHVYLVRTPTPVYNTTHHVLKRIAVANEAMLTEVKREVDIMRLLKGHPNIVHLIDAAWHKLPNGTFEVFILMEFCPGGGIIDMMNRRLRERLTEAEILQIFVDVCEGVAYMHNSRPPLLHRDLKVENILQSSATSYKLCDFGSATTVSPPPTNMQEIRALEADLNRHTTLQYRAPEMVDVYSKRPVNEKADIWALGVLLYKLCYYTTPFEEHGPLAILNVQYRIPPYPVYSQEMNALIASMLREHGAQRPTVFELLNHVHRLRGTKSKFTYNVPPPQPILPRPTQMKPLPQNPLDGLVTYTSSANKAPTAQSLYGPGSVAAAVPNQGIQARDQVLEAIAPMRRGRPTHSRDPSSRPPSPPKGTQDKTVKSWADNDFGADQDKAWQAATEKSGSSKTANLNDAWSVNTPSPSAHKAEKSQAAGFGDDFAEKLWNSSDPNNSVSSRPALEPNGTKPASIPITPLAFTGSRMLRPKQDRLPQPQSKDAFEGLGLTSSTAKPAPTLGEARKLRTGLATMSTPSTQSNTDYFRREPEKTTGASPRPTPSPRPNYLSPTSPQPQRVSPAPTSNHQGSVSSWRSTAAPTSPTEGLPIESRFPSLEELDARYTSPNPAQSLYPASVNVGDGSRFGSQSSSQSSLNRVADTRPQFTQRPSQNDTTGAGTSSLRPSGLTKIPSSLDGVRSEQVTGVAMRDRKEHRLDPTSADNKPLSTPERSAAYSSSKDNGASWSPSIIRKHRSSITMKADSFSSSSYGKPQEGRQDHSDNLPPPRLPARPPSNNSGPRDPPRDWLTGEDHDVKPSAPSEAPVLRASPSKRASYIENNDFQFSAPSTAQTVVAERLVDEPEVADLSPTLSKFNRSFPAIDRYDNKKPAEGSSGLTDNWSPVHPKKELDPDSSSGDEGPEDARAAHSTAPSRKTHGHGRGKGRQSSVHELVNQYGGGFSLKEKEPERPVVPTTSRILPRKPSVGLVPPPSKVPDRRTPSPTNRSNQYHPPQTSIQASQPSGPQASSKSPVGRSRPQSMFIFPSKPAESTAPAPPATSNLMPPEEPKARVRDRRTSITDMVQRYEAIGGKAPVASLPAGPPSPVRPLSAKGPLSIASTKSISDTSRAFPVQATTIEPTKSRTAGKEPVNLGLSKAAPSNIRGRIVSDKTVLSPTSDNISRAPNLSIRAEALQSASSTRTEPPRSPKKSSVSFPAARHEDAPPRSPSPDKPYQGVGKLIDQWQKKSVQVQDQPRHAGPKRNFPPTKRASLIPGEDR